LEPLGAEGSAEIERSNQMSDKKEYIERGALIAFVRGVRKRLPEDSKDFFTRDEMLLNFQQYVEMQHAADVEPVVHAHWIHEKYHGNLAIFSRCSKCGFQYNASIYDAKTFKSIIEKEYNYCPRCGAHMDERSEEK